MACLLDDSGLDSVTAVDLIKLDGRKLDALLVKQSLGLNAVGAVRL